MNFSLFVALLKKLTSEIFLPYSFYKFRQIFYNITINGQPFISNSLIIFPLIIEKTQTLFVPFLFYIRNRFNRHSSSKFKLSIDKRRIV